MDSILDAAEQLLRQRGYADTSMEEISTAAGISRKTLFNYVETKPALLEALIHRRFRAPYIVPFAESTALPTGTAADMLPPDPDARLAAMDACRWLLRLGVLHANLFSSDAAEADDLETNRPARTERVRQLQALGAIRADIAAEEVAWQFEVVRNAVFRRWLRREEATLEVLRREFATAMSLFLEGVRGARATG